MNLAALLVVTAIAVVAAGVVLIVQLDARLAGGGRVATRRPAALQLPGLRARHRAESKASPALFLLGSILTLLVVATLI